MDAKKAKEIQSKNIFGLDKIHTEIEIAAKNGMSRADILKPIRETDVLKLIDQGFRIERFENIYKEEVVRISW